MTVDTPTRWSPQTPEERELLLRELNTILSSHHFRNSKRYPALLKYVVNRTLDGDADQLKERTLGVEIFDRSPDYDTNADPIVRVTAGEVRKRIAQFYHEDGRESRFHIDIPLGSYVPEFKLKPVPLETHGAATHNREVRERDIREPQSWNGGPPLQESLPASSLAATHVSPQKKTRTALSVYALWT